MTTSRSGALPPSASSSVGASGVMPTAWNIATAPDDAAAAPSAFSRSSPVSAGSPTMTGTSGAGLAGPTMCPTHVGVTSSWSSRSGMSSASRNTTRAPPVLVEVQAGVRHPSGDRRADVDEVAVPVRPRARAPSSRTRSRSTRPTRRARRTPGAVRAGTARTSTSAGSPWRRTRPSACRARRRRVGVEPDELGVEQVERRDVQRGRAPRRGRRRRAAARRSPAPPDRDTGSCRRGRTSRRSGARPPRRAPSRPRSASRGPRPRRGRRRASPDRCASVRRPSR